MRRGVLRNRTGFPVKRLFATYDQGVHSFHKHIHQVGQRLGTRTNHFDSRPVEVEENFYRGASGHRLGHRRSKFAQHAVRNKQGDSADDNVDPGNILHNRILTGSPLVGAGL